MRVRLQTKVCGPNGNLDPGEHDVADDFGRDLCAGGYAVPMAEEVVERAVEPQAPVVEVRVDPKPKRRGR